jgi:HK97 gp10 family phage protein
MVSIQTKLTGNIEEKLDKFAAKVSGGILFKGTAAAATVVYEELKLNTSPPRMNIVTRNLHDAVYRVYSRDRSADGQPVYHVGVNMKKAPHWHLLEYGTSRMRAHPFIRPAFDRVGDAIKKGQARITELLATGDMV